MSIQERLAALPLAVALLFAGTTCEPVRAHSTLIINDVISPGTLGDDKLSLHEALGLATGSLQTFQLSPLEFQQVILDPGRFQIDTLIFDETVFPATIVLDAPLPVLDDPIGDYIDATNFNAFPVGSVVLDGSRLAAGTPAFDVRAGNTGIYGWRILRFPGDGIRVSPNPTFDFVRGLLLQRNLIEDCGGYGIALRNGTRNNIDWSFLMLENLALRCAQGGILIDAGTGDSITLACTVEANVLRENGLVGALGSGLALFGGRGGSLDANFNLVNNQVVANGAYGVLLDGGSSGTLMSGVLQGNFSTANAVGIGILGARGAGLAPNDVSVSVRGHRSGGDLLAALALTGGAEIGARDSFTSASIQDLLVFGGCSLAGALISGGMGSGNQVSVSMSQSAITEPSGHGVHLLTSVDDLGGQRLDARFVGVHVSTPGRTGYVLEAGTGMSSNAGLSFASCTASGGLSGAQVFQNPARPGGLHQVNVSIRDGRYQDTAREAFRVEASTSLSLDLTFRRSVFDGGSGDALVVVDPLQVGGVQLDLGTAQQFGANTFVSFAGAAIRIPAWTQAVEAIGNYYGDSSGPAPMGTGLGVFGSLNVQPFLQADPSLRLDLSERRLGLGDTLAATLAGTPGTPAGLYVGTRVFDLTALGQPLFLDAMGSPVVRLASGTLPFTTRISIPLDPALSGATLLFQGLGGGRLSRVHPFVIR